MVGRKRQTKSENVLNESSTADTKETNLSTSKENLPPETQIDKKEEFRNKINSILEEFELELQAKVRGLQELAEAHAVTLQNCMAVQLVKIPKRVREMPLANFRTQYREDVSTFLMTEIKTGIKRQLRSGVKRRKTKNEPDSSIKDVENKKRKPPLPPTKPPVQPDTTDRDETDDMNIWASTPASAVMRRRRKMVANIVTTETEKINEEIKQRLHTPKSIQTKGKKNIQSQQKRTTESEHKSISKLLQEMRASHTTPAQTTLNRAVHDGTKTYSELDVPLHIQLQSGVKIDLSTPQTLHKITGTSKEEAKLKLSMLQERILECLKELDNNE
ncbi:hypothetical protein GpartN1_g6390.t1 [Galdieria partita]|uniref:Borealin N-terminal domain-containing protein n=1 Tax=Galdieria partita TaxID=83374 RepID=A0A9C7Q2G4_9RHOD|nr:hypothetical protein GpartN1_g6390.t1 [Galdieria partita]